MAYGAALASSVRCEMLKAAATAFYFGHPADMDQALKLIDFVGKLSGRRNDIAHGMVMEYLSPGTPYDGFYLTPPSYQTRKGSSHTMAKPKPTLDPKFQYTADQILDFASAFDAATNNVSGACIRALMRGQTT